LSTEFNYSEIVSVGSNRYITPVDLTDTIQYERMVGEISTVSAITAPFYMQEFLKAKEMAGRLYARALYAFEQAHDRSYALKAIAMLDKAPEALKAKGIRANDEFCKQYAMTDPDYLEAREAEAYWTAMVKHLENKVFKFQSAHDDVRQIHQKSRDSTGSVSALPSGE
jgi:hypothetical protein